jgi:phenylalanyl-tRNA synthetase beta chain
VEERTHLVGLLFGEGLKLPWAREALSGFFLLKGYLEALFRRLGLELRVEAHPYPFLHPGVSGRVLVEGEEKGFLGQLHPGIARALALPPVWIFELTLPSRKSPWPSGTPPATPRPCGTWRWWFPRLPLRGGGAGDPGGGGPLPGGAGPL